jgi:hypothetical protein
MKISIYTAAKTTDEGEGEHYSMTVILRPEPDCDSRGEENDPFQEITLKVGNYETREKASQAAVAFASVFHPDIATAVCDAIGALGYHEMHISFYATDAYEKMRATENGWDEEVEG